MTTTRRAVPEHLREIHAGRRNETVKRVNQAIREITDEGKSVTLERIKEFSSRQGPPIAISTVMRNPQAYELYIASRPQQNRTRRVAGSSVNLSEAQTKRYYYLRRYKKTELIHKILECEDRIRKMDDELYKLRERLITEEG